MTFQLMTGKPHQIEMGLLHHMMLLPVVIERLDRGWRIETEGT